jgi:hypothetical protein
MSFVAERLACGRERRLFETSLVLALLSVLCLAGCIISASLQGMRALSLLPSAFIAAPVLARRCVDQSLHTAAYVPALALERSKATVWVAAVWVSPEIYVDVVLVTSY